MLWSAATDDLADEIISAQQRAYLRLTRLRAIVEDTALLSVPDAFTRDVIESRLRPAITDALSRRLGRAIQVAVTVRPPEDGTGMPGKVYGKPPPPPPAPQPQHYAPTGSAQHAAPPRPHTGPVPTRREPQQPVFPAEPQAPLVTPQPAAAPPAAAVEKKQPNESGRRMATEHSQLRENLG